MNESLQAFSPHAVSSTMKKITIPAIILFAAIVGTGIYGLLYEPPRYSDFDVFAGLQNYFISVLQTHNGVERSVSREFRDFAFDVPFPWNRLYGYDVVKLRLKSFENVKLAAATLSQFVTRSKPDDYQDFTLSIRPRYGIKAPLLSVDFTKPAAGLPGGCMVDFINVDTDTISTEQFLGAEMAKVQQALTLVKKYQCTAEQGRGETTAYLAPWKSRYRLELQEPKTESKAVREKYYITVQEAIKLFVSAYMNSLAFVQYEAAYATQHEAKTKHLILKLYAQDEQVAYREKVFGKKFEKYWLDAFFNVTVKLRKG